MISVAQATQSRLILDGRYSTKEKVTKHEFTFSGLVHCGHCGCALVGEKKKGKCVYYHCTGNKGKCPEPYAREEVLEACFGYKVSKRTDEYGNHFTYWAKVQDASKTHVGRWAWDVFLMTQR
jgi:site-specific DNA recombinase